MTRALLIAAAIIVTLTIFGVIYAEAFGPGGTAHAVGSYKVFTAHHVYNCRSGGGCLP